MPATVAALGLCALAVAPTAAAAGRPEMHFGSRIARSTVCFTVTNPAGGRSTLFGQRYRDVAASDAPATPAIVLVHGIASSTENWDFSPTWSVARGLAAAGYTVYSYDRLGYAKSPYTVPGGGFTLTTKAHRAQLHQVVQEVQAGSYTQAPGGSCTGSHTAGTVRSRRVVIIGHSAGGWIVSGYPGTYHDVAAMVSADIDGSGAKPPKGTPTPPPSKGGSMDPDPADPSFFDFFHTRRNCEEFNTYPPGEVAYVVRIACTPPFIPSPFGEVKDFGVKFKQNDRAIDRIGPRIPVLLTSGDHDAVDPVVDADADAAYYRHHCHCSVTQLVLPKTAHLFMVHTSLPIWLNHVVGWLESKGISPVRRTAPVSCTDCVVRRFR